MASDARILLIEPQRAPREALQRSLEALGYEVVASSDREDALARVDQFRPEVVLASHGVLDADLGNFLRGEVDARSAVVVIFPRGTKDPMARAVELGADGGFARPVSRDTFKTLLFMAAAMTAERRAVARLERRVEEMGEQLERLGDVRPGQRFYHYDFFKHLLLVEIRRAKRYKYPLSVCLVELDPYRLPPGHLMARRDIRAGVARAVSESIRDIDIPVYVGGERILIVLPHTPRTGAQKVARRVARLIREGMYSVGEDVLDITASIGVAGLDEDRRLSFAQLIRDAQRALDEAREMGGDRIVART